MAGYPQYLNIPAELGAKNVVTYSRILYDALLRWSAEDPKSEDPFWPTTFPSRIRMSEPIPIAMSYLNVAPILQVMAVVGVAAAILGVTRYVARCEGVQAQARYSDPPGPA